MWINSVLRILTRAGRLEGESCRQWPLWIRCRCTSSSAEGSVQKWSAVLTLVYSKAQGPTVETGLIKYWMIKLWPNKMWVQEGKRHMHRLAQFITTQQGCENWSIHRVHQHGFLLIEDAENWDRSLFIPNFLFVYCSCCDLQQLACWHAVCTAAHHYILKNLNSTCCSPPSTAQSCPGASPSAPCGSTGASVPEEEGWPAWFAERGRYSEKNCSACWKSENIPHRWDVCTFCKAHIQDRHGRIFTEGKDKQLWEHFTCFQSAAPAPEPCGRVPQRAWSFSLPS